MGSSTSVKAVVPPRIFEALQTGFDQTAKHLGLILFPVILDLFLWLGPQLRVKKIFQPYLDQWIDLVNRSGTPEMQAFLTLNQSSLQQTIDQYNLISIFRAFPIGIPSLEAGAAHNVTPLGAVISYDLSEMLPFFLIGIGLLLAGITAGALFFISIARDFQEERIGVGLVIRQVVGTFSIVLVLLLILLVVLIPSIIIMTVLGEFSLGIAQFVGMVIFFILIWLLLPLVFSAHGMYLSGQNPLISLLSSVRLVRGFMPGTGLFLVVSLLVNEGLNIIWNIPESQSWMTLVGILGHGFVATSLIAASFSYYRSGVNWMKEQVERSMQGTANI